MCDPCCHLERRHSSPEDNMAASDPASVTTELDRQLVRATKVALSASYNIAESGCCAHPDAPGRHVSAATLAASACASNANNTAAAVAPPAAQSPESQRRKRHERRESALGRALRSLFGRIALRPGRSQTEACNNESNVGQVRREPCGCPGRAGNAAAAHVPVVNASNVKATKKSPPPTPSPQQKQQPQPSPPSSSQEQQKQPQPSPPRHKSSLEVVRKKRNNEANYRNQKVIRGGPTSVDHRQLQEAAIFKDCRIVPLDTFYKKVAMVPGRERLFLSAPSNPRARGSRMMYDIAYENFRHHADCNRDFTRNGLKKICSNYCRPSQFRYVY